MALKIKTDGKWKNFKYRYEVPKKILKSEFDYQDKEDEEEVQDGYILFNKHWYHLDQFMALRDNSPFDGPSGSRDWDGYASDSYSSGVLIKVSKDGDQYKIATYMS